MLFENEFSPPDKFPSIPKIRRSDENDCLWLDALQNLAHILHEDELVKYRAEIESTLTLSQRLAVWRGRHATQI